MLNSPNNDDAGEVYLRLEVDLTKIAFSFIDHCCPLLVIKCLLVLNYLVVGLDDNGDQEVHEDYEDEERAQDKHEERKYDALLRKAVMFFRGTNVIDQVKPMDIVDDREITHGTSQD